MSITIHEPSMFQIHAMVTSALPTRCVSWMTTVVQYVAVTPNAMRPSLQSVVQMARRTATNASCA